MNSCLPRTKNRVMQMATCTTQLQTVLVKRSPEAYLVGDDGPFLSFQQEIRTQNSGSMLSLVGVRTSATSSASPANFEHLSQDRFQAPLPSQW